MISVDIELFLPIILKTLLPHLIQGLHSKKEVQITETIYDLCIFFRNSSITYATSLPF